MVNLNGHLVTAVPFAGCFTGSVTSGSSSGRAWCESQLGAQQLGFAADHIRRDDIDEDLRLNPGIAYPWLASPQIGPVAAGKIDRPAGPARHYYRRHDSVPAEPGRGAAGLARYAWRNAGTCLLCRTRTTTSARQ